MAITNALLAQQLSELFASWRLRETEYQSWLTGAANGGVYGDGRFSLTDLYGELLWVKSPARLEADVNGTVNSALTHKTEAQSAAQSASNTLASVQASLAQIQSLAGQVQADRLLSESARDLGAGHAAVARTLRDDTQLLADQVSADRLAAESSATSAGNSEALSLAYKNDAAASATLATQKAADAAASAAIIDPAAWYNRAQVDQMFSDLVNGTPATLDTLNELAAALGDDPNFATTVTNMIAGKANASHTHGFGEVPGLQAALDTKLNASAYTAADVLAKLLTVDGAASGIDAQYLAGKPLTYFQGMSPPTTSQDPNSAADPVILTNHANSPSSACYWHITTTFYSSVSSSANRGQIAVRYNGTPHEIYSRHYYAGGEGWTAWARVWTDANFTPAQYTKLDAGGATQTHQNGVQSFRKDGTDAGSATGGLATLEVYNGNTTTGDAFITFHNGNRFATYFGLNGATNRLFAGGWSAGSTKHQIIDERDVSTIGGASRVLKTDGSGYLVLDNWIRVGTSTGLFNAAGNHMAPEASGWYFRAPTAYGGANLRLLRGSDGVAIGSVHADGTYVGLLSPGGGWLVQAGYNGTRILTNSGNCEIGPQNTGWCHFYTDRPQFYFNKPVGIDGTLFRYNAGAMLYHTNAGHSSGRIVVKAGTATLSDLPYSGDIALEY